MSWSVEALRASVMVKEIKWNPVAVTKPGWAPIVHGQYKLGNEKLVQRAHPLEADIVVSKFSDHPVVVVRDPLDGSYDLLVETRAIEVLGLAEQVRKHVLETAIQRKEFTHKQGHFTEDALTRVSFRGVGRRPSEQSYYSLDRVLEVAQAILKQDVSGKLAQEMRNAIEIGDDAFD